VLRSRLESFETVLCVESTTLNFPGVTGLTDAVTGLTGAGRVERCLSSTVCVESFWWLSCF
jgi:hypothetical protein